MNTPTARSSHRRLLVAGLAGVATLAIIGGAVTPALAAQHPSLAAKALHDANPNPLAGTVRGSNLYGASSTSPTDVWTFGTHLTASGINALQARHYDGTSWTTVHAPMPAGADGVTILGPISISPNDVWALGHSSSNGVYSTLAEHWDGTKWSIVPTPNLSGADDSYFYDASGLSSDDIWVAGTGLLPGGDDQSLLEHWDGTSWTVVPTAKLITPNSVLEGVAEVSPTDIWATGWYQNSAGTLVSLVEHYNGTKWKVVANSDPDGWDGTVYGQAVVAGPNDIWSLGYSQNPDLQLVPVAGHYNGKKWSFVQLPNPADSADAILVGAGASGPNDIWGVGLYLDSSTFQGDLLVEHFDGTSWTESSPKPPKSASGSSNFEGVTAPADGSAFAVGQTTENGVGVKLTEQWNGKVWKP